MIRVLHIIDSMRGGGKERQFVELLKGFKARKGFASSYSPILGRGWLSASKYFRLLSSAISNRDGEMAAVS